MILETPDGIPAGWCIIVREGRAPILRKKSILKGPKPLATPNELSPRRIKDTRNGFAKD